MSSGQAGKMETQGRANAAVLSPKAVWKQKSFLLGGFSLFHLRPSIAGMRHALLEEVIERMRPLINPLTGHEQLEAPHPHPNLGPFILPTIPILGAFFKGTTLRDKGSVEPIWTVHVTEAC